MKKYEMLVKEFADEIAAIKQLRTELADAEQRYNQYAYTETREEVDAYHDASTINTSLHELESWLEFALSMEYVDCPFFKTREQGIKAFYALAGL